jgi:hypothetical protein
LRQKTYGNTSREKSAAQSVLIDDSFSTPVSLVCGVSQGSVLRPILFSIYLHNIGSVLEKHGLKFALFADDLQAVATETAQNIHLALEKIQRAACELRTWLACRKLKMNELKTEILVIGNKKLINQGMLPTCQC